jgi:hypothetical protein
VCWNPGRFFWYQLQVTTSKQCPNIEIPKLSVIDFWKLRFICILVLEIWNFVMAIQINIE